MNTARRLGIGMAATLIGCGMAFGSAVPAEAAQNNVAINGTEGRVSTMCQTTSPHPHIGAIYRANLTLAWEQRGSFIKFDVVGHRLDVPDPARGRAGARVELRGPGSGTPGGPLTQTGLSALPSGTIITPAGVRDFVDGPFTSANAWTRGTARDASTELSLRVVFDKKNSVAPIPIYHIASQAWRDVTCDITVRWNGTRPVVDTSHDLGGGQHWWSDRH